MDIYFINAEKLFRVLKCFIGLLKNKYLLHFRQNHVILEIESDVSGYVRIEDMQLGSKDRSFTFPSVVCMELAKMQVKDVVNTNITIQQIDKSWSLTYKEVSYIIEEQTVSDLQVFNLDFHPSGVNFLKTSFTLGSYLPKPKYLFFNYGCLSILNKDKGIACLSLLEDNIDIAVDTYVSIYSLLNKLYENRLRSSFNYYVDHINKRLYTLTETDIKLSSRDSFKVEVVVKTKCKFKNNVPFKLKDVIKQIKVKSNLFVFTPELLGKLDSLLQQEGVKQDDLVEIKKSVKITVQIYKDLIKVNVNKPDFESYLKNDCLLLCFDGVFLLTTVYKKVNK